MEFFVWRKKFQKMPFLHLIIIVSFPFFCWNWTVFHSIKLNMQHSNKKRRISSTTALEAAAAAIWAKDLYMKRHLPPEQINKPTIFELENIFRHVVAWEKNNMMKTTITIYTTNGTNERCTSFSPFLSNMICRTFEHAHRVAKQKINVF